MARDHNAQAVKLIEKKLFYSARHAVAQDDGFADKEILSLLELTQNDQRALLNRWSVGVHKSRRSGLSLIWFF